MQNINKFTESELIINSDGSIYHLKLKPHEIANTIITVGDPNRVEMVTKHFDKIEVIQKNREFCTHTGLLENKRITVISTGIGTDNIDIVMNELDALANIDFNTRCTKNELTTLNFIRIGTSGALQSHIPIDSFVVSEYGLGNDALLHYYNYANNDLENTLLKTLQPIIPLKPYLIAADPQLVQHFGNQMHKGITATSPGFYAPQGRQLRANIKYPNLLDNLQKWQYQHYQIVNFEMETAGIYGMARCLNHKAVSLNAILAQRAKKQFSSNPNKAIEKLIEHTLQKILTF